MSSKCCIGGGDSGKFRAEEADVLAFTTPEPNWKELKLLGDRIDLGFRLMCQLWVSHDLEIEQIDSV
jgi:hypothetical protein